jgi:hypothetical protein
LKRAVGSLGVLGLALLCFLAIRVGHYATVTPTCAAVQSGQVELPADRRCIDTSASRRTAVAVLAWSGAGAAAVGAVLCLLFVVTGARARLALAFSALALALVGLCFVIGSF